MAIGPAIQYGMMIVKGMRENVLAQWYSVSISQVVAPRWVRKETPADHSGEVLGLCITGMACSVHLCILKVGCSDGFGHSGEVLGLCITGVGC